MVPVVVGGMGVGEVMGVLDCRRGDLVDKAELHFFDVAV